MGWRNVWRTGWRGRLAAVVLVAAAPGVAAGTPCSIVLPQPRGAELDSAWWQINLALADAVAAGLAERGQPVLRLQVPSEAPVAALVQALLEQSDRHGCDHIVETSLYPGEGDSPLIVARLRAYPVRRGDGPSRIGEPTVTLRQEYPDTQRNRDRLTPAQLAREFVQEYAQRSGAAAAPSPRP